jgi:hypothetical protein
MNLKLGALAAAAVAAAAMAAPTTVLAHHSFAMFDRTKQQTIKGTVKDFQWTNPHVWVQLVVRNTEGQTEEWSIEAAPPNMLFRQGWDNTTFKVGDNVSVVINPLRNGGHGGTFVAATLANGKTIGNANGRPPPG